MYRRILFQPCRRNKSEQAKKDELSYIRLRELLRKRLTKVSLNKSRRS